MCNRDSLAILEFLNTHHGVEYHDQNYPGITNEQRDHYRDLATRGSHAADRMDTLCRYFSDHFGLALEYHKTWQNSGHIVKYFWGRLKHQQHLDSPICIAIFARSGDRFEIRLEIEKNNCDDETFRIQLLNYYKYLELPVEINTGLVFIQDKNKYPDDNDEFFVDTRPRTEIQRDKLQAPGTLDNRVWLSYYIERDRCCDEEFIKGIETIQRYYNHIFGL